MKKCAVNSRGVLGSLSRHVVYSFLVLSFLFSAIFIYFSLIKWRVYDREIDLLRTEHRGLIERKEWLDLIHVLNADVLLARQVESSAVSHLAHEADPLFFHAFSLLDGLIQLELRRAQDVIVPNYLIISIHSNVHAISNELRNPDGASSMGFREFLNGYLGPSSVRNARSLLDALIAEQSLRIRSAERDLVLDIGLRAGIFVLISFVTLMILARFRWHFFRYFRLWERQKRVLAVAQERMRFAMRSGSLGYIDWSLATRSFIVGSDYAPFIGLKSGRYTVDDWLNTISTDDRERIRDLLFRLRDESGRVRTEYHTTHGGICGIEASIFRIRNELRFIGTVWDLGPEKLRDTQIEQMRLLQVETARLASLGEMSSGIAHEINNPLAVISGKTNVILGLIRDESSLTVQIRPHLQKIESNVVRISRIIRGLRLVSRDSARDSLTQESFNEILETSLSLCAERTRLKAIRLEIDIESSKEVLVNCRPSQISQILVNLLNNAIDAVESSVTPWISVKTVTSEGRIQLMVRDSGIGVPVGLEDQIMRPFFTTKEPGKGTGLGLSISSRIATEHGGALRLMREISNSCFCLELPRFSRPSVADVA